MGLSKENYDKLNTNLLYKKQPTRNDSYTYHCKNWTFRVYKNDDNCTAWMVDTYFNSWDSHKIQVTDNNINEFEVVFNFKEVMQIHDDEADEYENEDVYCVATNSGGYSCGRLYWVKKDAQKSKKLLIEKKKAKIDYLKRQLRWVEDDLKRLEMQ